MMAERSEAVEKLRRSLYRGQKVQKGKSRWQRQEGLGKLGELGPGTEGGQRA